jgi:hypothetical protein
MQSELEQRVVSLSGNYDHTFPDMVLVIYFLQGLVLEEDFM